MQGHSGILLVPPEDSFGFLYSRRGCFSVKVRKMKNGGTDDEILLSIVNSIGKCINLFT